MQEQTFRENMGHRDEHQIVRTCMLKLSRWFYETDLRVVRSNRVQSSKSLATMNGHEIALTSGMSSVAEN
jgi:hypothetical protein